ncbi:MAG: hypothetical protein LBM64_07375 [Deltaproteobacteria bacterium]|jgi:hypothetical protein|nr:hypothetical protein [Deltaproteobacteria bacterium]
MSDYVWKTQLGFFSTATMSFVEEQAEYIPLYMDTTDPENLLLADKDFLRGTITFYGFQLPEILLTLQERIQVFMNKIQARLDNFARTRGYDSVLSAASYATSNNAIYQVEGQYVVDARDATWEWSNDYLNQVLAGQKEIPPWEEFEA